MISKTRLRLGFSLSLSLLGASAVSCDYGNDEDKSNTNPLAPFGEGAEGDGTQNPVADEGNGQSTPAEGSSEESPTPGAGPDPAPAAGDGAEGPADPVGIDMGDGEGSDGMPGEGETDPGEMMSTEEETPVEPEPVVRPEGPCDLYGTDTPCVGAYSMVRALNSAYEGPLYEVRRGAPNALQNTGTGGDRQNIGMLPNGFADAAAQDAFCGDQPCTVSTLYDQSGLDNHLTVAKAGCYIGTASEDDYESNAKELPLTVGGNSVYGLFMEPHQGYRNNDAINTPEGDVPMGIYMVSAGSGTRANPPPACCWNFGIASRDNCYGPTGMMNALFFGRAFWGEGAGNGPWFMGDFEAGVWAGGINGGIGRPDLGDFDVNQNNPSMTMDYAFGILKSAPNSYTIRTANAQQGNVSTAWDGPTPLAMNRWQMEGGIILGIGGDNSNSSRGTFFEGVITAGRPSDEVDAAVLANVQAAGYGQ